ncbi:sialate O-acetylesterase [Paraglaciecola aquimarina]|uniref:Sialate O-acetylesterase n=1 Tax=Paraglaciecola aquimarina TaxID=1235557 RepID=A0ABU3SS46_9ALTE|nr:sialate O-acetylesterase [Paraglaciecola aquimarina]MDU0352838.1 sialate O-acetylesterase [Paraglaciecola aquimarina]
MKTYILIVLLSLLVSACSVNNIEANKQDIHVYILIGQSNMAGRAPVVAQQFNVIDDTLLLDAEGQWQLANNPLNRYSSIRKKMSMQKLGIGYAFAKTMQAQLATQQPSAKIGLVVNAKGGSSIVEWQPSEFFYQEVLRRAKQAQQTGTLKGILWHQGESDFEDADYLPKLVALVNNLRADLQHPTLPFVAGQIHDTPLINHQIAALPSHLACTGYVSSAELTAMDRWHFDNDSMLKLGAGYAETMLKIQQQK